MEHKTLIIGAGAAGLMAGAMLAKDGFQVTIVEGSQRLGGRIHTDTSSFGFPAEFGAEFVHGDQPETFSTAKNAQTRLTKVSGAWIRIMNGVTAPMEEFSDQWEDMLEKMNSLREDTTLDEFLKRFFNGNEQAAFRNYVLQFAEGYDAADSGVVSVFALREEWAQSDDETQYRPEGGYHGLIVHLKDEILNHHGKLELGFQVKKIGWEKGRVHISDANGKSLTGNSCVIAVPVAVLQSGSVTFEPAIPDYSSAFQKFGNGGVIKFLFQFKEAFWDSIHQEKFKGLSFILSDAPVPTWWTQRPGNAPLLTGWLAGPPSFQNLSDDQLHQNALSSLQYIFNIEKGKLESFIQHYEIVNWVKDPLSLGAYAYATLDSSSAKKILSAPVGDTIFFAGEYLYEGPAMGTVEAALRSGKSAAKRLIEMYL